jgi:DNA-binding LytR/AlgR family response regulator
MDIQMPGLTGLQFIQSMPKRPMVVLITAYKKFATEGFDLDVVDYIVKPVGMDRFMKACYKAQELHQLRNATATGTRTADFFFVNVDYSLVKVLFADIVWIEGAGDYVKIHLKGGAKPLLVRMSAKAIESELPADQFVRIHKSYIVAIAAITAVRKNSVFIGPMELPVSESHKDALRQLIRRNF